MYFCIAFPNGLILLRELVGNQKADNYKALFESFIVLLIRLNIGSTAKFSSRQLQNSYSKTFTRKLQSKQCQRHRMAGKVTIL